MNNYFWFCFIKELVSHMYGDSEQVLAIKDMNTFSGLLSVSDCLKTLTCEILQFVSLDFFQM